MTRRKVALAPRREPKQERSLRMRDDILAAAVRVLRKEGFLRFTTPRVARAAGVSVGSLYQYFPNKQAILFAVHSRRVEEVWAAAQAIVDGPASARAKLRRVAELFFRAETEDVREMGPAAQELDLLFGKQPFHREFERRVAERVGAFVADALPAGASRRRIERGADVVMTVIESVGKSVAARGLGPEELDAWARDCADMIGDHLGLERSPAPDPDQRLSRTGATLLP